MKPKTSLKTARARKLAKKVGASDPREIQNLLRMIDKALRLRFREYSPDVEALAPLSLITDAQTLDEAFSKACCDKTFDDFCRSVARICDKYKELTESLNVEPSLVIANVFNNHVATVLGKPGEITAQFLETSVRSVSPELADRLDFKRAKSEPTVFVFGNNVSRICDLLFTIPYKDGRKEEFPIIVLMEHKSAPDRNVVKQMLTSLVATLDFAERYPERFKTPDGKIIWPFVVLFYTGAQQWNEVQNLPDLFTTSLKELDEEWIFKLRFLLVSLVDKRIDVLPTTSGKAKKKPPKTFDEALQNADWLKFFFDLLRKAEILTSNPRATREEWLKDVGESLRIVKDARVQTDEYANVILDDALSFVNTMCAKKNFALPTRDELVGVMKREEMQEMVRRTWLLSDEEWEAAEAKGRRDEEREGIREGERKGKLELLAQMIGLRFPKATPTFIQKTLKPFVDSDPTELMSVVMGTDTLEEFKKRVKTLIPAGC